jgi:exodeoxyribonuclease-3
LKLRIASWNVNSLRQRMDHLARLIEERAPDVICLQEIKMAEEIFPAEDLSALGYPHHVVAGQKGYNGVAIISRVPFADRQRLRWCARDDKRHASVELPGGLRLHNFYVPSGGPKPDPEVNDKFAHKIAFLKEMASWASVEARGRKLLLVGDLNVAPLENDVWNHKRLLRSVGHTPLESGLLSDVLRAGGLTDVGRHFVPADQPLYTWWGYRFAQAFDKDYGWRLDHAFASAALMEGVQGLEIFRETRAWEQPSDHVPVIVDLA